MLIPTNQVSTRYSNTQGKSNLVINLMFLQSESTELNNHLIHPKWYLTSDYAPLIVTIPIIEEILNMHGRRIPSSSILQDILKASGMRSVTNT